MAQQHMTYALDIHQAISYAEGSRRDEGVENRLIFSGFTVSLSRAVPFRQGCTAFPLQLRLVIFCKTKSFVHLPHFWGPAIRGRSEPFLYILPFLWGCLLTDNYNFMRGLLVHGKGGKLVKKFCFIICTIPTCLLQTVGMLLYTEDIVEPLATSLGHGMRKNTCQIYSDLSFLVGLGYYYFSSMYFV